MEPELNVPFFRPDVGQEEIDETVDTLRSGWLTSGPKVSQFERQFATAVGAKYAVAVNSCTAALHLAVEALGLSPGQGVLVPTMTFAATAEVVRYMGAIPVLVDCDPTTGNMDLADAEAKLEQIRRGDLPSSIPKDLKVVGIIPVHVGGMMLNVDSIHGLANTHRLWIVEDAAHALPAAWRPNSSAPWQRCGEGTGRVACFSFYANKTITTGEGGMAVTDEAHLAERMRLMSLHGLSHDAWGRYSGQGKWDYQIVAPGFKYNLTDIAASIGIHQLARAEDMRRKREAVAREYIERLADIEEISLPPDNGDRIHSWHLFPIRLRLDRLTIDRDAFIEALKTSRVGCSVHWRPLHLHPYYQESFGWAPEHLPVATSIWTTLISLPIFSGMTADEIDHVVNTVHELCSRHARKAVADGSKTPTSDHMLSVS